MTDSLIALPLLGFLVPLALLVIAPLLARAVEALVGWLTWLALTPARLASRRRVEQALDEAYRERHIRFHERTVT